ncbi:MAG: hypothetical protein NC388_05245 [Clostridium sp.]|nr:hypothetical protein [Clostridium sp.]
MKKKFFVLSSMVMMFCMGIYAQKRTVTLHNDDLTEDERYYETPVVNYDDNTVSIFADTLIYSATVVVRDGSGRVIHQEQIVITPNETELNIAKEQLAGKSSVEVYYDDKRLYGYFEE